MKERASAVAVPVRLHRRVRRGLRRPANWFQLVRFGTVGATGYLVNLAVFTAAVHQAGLGYALAATMAFVVAVANNFWWNRHWTFSARAGHAGFQAARFVTVSLAGLTLNLLALFAFIDGLGLERVPAQAIAILCATPITFIGNKLWTFRP
jgi:putative flippase GtrA